MINHPAAVRNRGLEISVNAVVLNRKDWDISFNIFSSKNSNKLVKFPGLESSSFNGQYKIGESLSTRYYLHYTGVDPLTGTYTFEDYNKDGKLYFESAVIPTSNQDDRYVKINTDPKMNLRGGLAVQYKSFALHTSFLFNNQLK